MTRGGSGEPTGCAPVKAGAAKSTTPDSLAQASRDMASKTHKEKGTKLNCDQGFVQKAGQDWGVHERKAPVKQRDQASTSRRNSFFPAMSEFFCH